MEHQIYASQKKVTQPLVVIVETFRMYVCVICKQTFAMKNWLKNLSKKSTLSSDKIIVAKYSEIEMKWTITFRYVNQSVMNAVQNMRLKITTTKKYC